MPLTLATCHPCEIERPTLVKKYFAWILYFILRYLNRYLKLSLFIETTMRSKLKILSLVT